MPIISRARREIWTRRIKNFWFDFSHNKVGIFGLILLSFFVIIGVFAPVIATHNPSQTSLSGQFSMPEWMAIFPQYSSLPRHTVHQFNWTVEQCPVGINTTREGDKWLIHYNGSGTGGEPVSVIYNATFNYPYDPLDRYTFEFYWAASPEKVNLTECTTYIKPKLHMNFTICKNATGNAQYMLEVTMTNAGNETYSLWDQEWDSKKERIGAILGEEEKYYKLKFWSKRSDEKIAHVGSCMGACSLRQGYETHEATEVAQTLFAYKGTYVFRMNVTFKPGVYRTEKDGKIVYETFLPQNATANAHITPFEFTIWGKLHGLMGTDSFGCDVFSQLIYGTQISLAIGLTCASMSTVLGILVGVTAGYMGGAVDEVLMRTVDILLCLPVLPILLVLVSLYGRNVYYIVLIIAVFGWQGLSRLLRSQVLSLREMPYIESATASGASKSYIMMRHLVPNILPTALADMILSVPGAILLEAGLSFIGFGDPMSATWGRMLERGFTFGGFAKLAWWWVIPPGLAITLICISFVFIGHAIDEIVNPRLRRRR